MNNNKKMKKAIALSVMVAMLSASTAMAQTEKNRGGLFYRGTATNEYDQSGMMNGNRDSHNGTFSNQDFESPIGSGLLILAAAGAGYALLRRKEDKQ